MYSKWIPLYIYTYTHIYTHTHTCIYKPFTSPKKGLRVSEGATLLGKSAVTVTYKGMFTFKQTLILSIWLSTPGERLGSPAPHPFCWLGCSVHQELCPGGASAEQWVRPDVATSLKVKYEGEEINRQRSEVRLSETQGRVKWKGKDAVECYLQVESLFPTNTLLQATHIVGFPEALFLLSHTPISRWNPDSSWKNIPSSGERERRAGEITEPVRLAGRHTGSARLSLHQGTGGMQLGGRGEWRPSSWFCESQGVKVQGGFLGKAENKILNAMYSAAGMWYFLPLVKLGFLFYVLRI